MGQNFKLTGVALSVATVFGVLASGSAMAGALDSLPIPQVIVNPPTNSVSVGLVATGTSPLGSVTVTAGGSGAIQTSLGDPGHVLSGAVGAVTGALSGGGGVQPLAPVQGVVNQVTGALGGGNPAGALTGALNTATGALSNAVGTATGALGGIGGGANPLAPVQGVVNQVTGALSGGNPAGALTGALNTATGTLSNALGTATGALGGIGGGSNPLAPVQGVVNQVTGALSGGNPAGALNTATGTLSNALGTATGALGGIGGGSNPLA
ncbi:hypothetical protein A8F44_04180, partial [Burkholderia cenocepacia]